MQLQEAMQNEKFRKMAKRDYNLVKLSKIDESYAIFLPKFWAENISYREDDDNGEPTYWVTVTTCKDGSIKINPLTVQEHNKLSKLYKVTVDGKKENKT